MPVADLEYLGLDHREWIEARRSSSCTSGWPDPEPSEWRKWLRPARIFFFEVERPLPAFEATPIPLDPAEKAFEDLSVKWRAETMHMSSITDIVLNEHYQSVIGLGPAVVPLLLKRLAASPDHWFWALQSITRTNPVAPEDAGDMRRMAQAWLDWGRQNEFL